MLQWGYESLIDLDPVQFQLLEIAYTGKAGAKVVQGDLDAQTAEALDDFRGPFWTPDQKRLRNFQLKPLGLKTRILQDDFDVLDQVSIPELGR